MAHRDISALQRFGHYQGTADMAGLVAGSTRSRMTQNSRSSICQTNAILARLSREPDHEVLVRGRGKCHALQTTF